MKLTLRELECKLVTHFKEIDKGTINGVKHVEWQFISMHGTLEYLEVKNFPKKITVIDTDKDNEIYTYEVDSLVENKIVYKSKERNVPIYLRAA